MIGGIRIGLLHSLSGPMAVSERALMDLERLAIDEINAGGGVLGRRVEPVVVDGCSDAETFAARAEELVGGGIHHLFGCWTSASRKSVKAVLDRRGGLLWYPVQYEGLEQSTRIVYAGSCLNQQAIPALKWGIERFGPRLFLVGSDYVFPRAAHALFRSFVEEDGAGGGVLGERLKGLSERNFEEVVASVAAARPDFVVNTLNGEGNLWFLEQYAASAARSTPIISLSVGEPELRGVAALPIEHYACWSYFQSLRTQQNGRFVAALRRRHGSDSVVGAPGVSAYSQIQLWREVVTHAGCLDVERVIEHLPDTSFDGPAGRWVVLPNHHVALSAYIGRLRRDGQFEVQWESPEPIRPLPWLGIEEAGLRNTSMIRCAMAAFPELTHAEWTLEREIARREVAERALREAAARLQGLVASGVVGFFVSDASGEISEANDAFLTMVGRSRDDVASGRLRSVNVTPPEWRELDDRALARMLATGAAETWEKEYVHVDGHRVPVLIGLARISPTSDRCVCFVLDISERKRAEVALRRSRDRADALNRDLDAFVYAVSHDLRAPLIAIDGFARGLLESRAGHLDEHDVADIERIRAAALRTGSITDHLLQLSRVTRGELRALDMDLSAAARSIVDELRARSRRDVAVVVADGLHAYADPILVRLVLENLLDNAWKFVAREEHPRIEVGAEVRDGEQVFFVRDNGVGFDPAKKTRLFEPFERLHPMSEFPGHGLGLSIVRRIVERHGGTVWGESAPGCGATFRFTLSPRNQPAMGG